MTVPLGEVAIKSSITKSYLSIVSFFVHWKSIFFLPTFNEFGVNSIYKYTSLHGLNLKPSLYNISAKNHLNRLKNLLFESLFLWVFVAIFGCSNIFDQRLLFDHKQPCIWPLELSEPYEPGNHSINQRLKSLWNSRKKKKKKKKKYIYIIYRK